MLALLSATLLVGAGCSGEKQGRDVVIATATEGGTYIVIGQQLARLLKEYPVDEIRSAGATPSAGTDENITRLLGDSQFFLLVVNKKSGIETLDDLKRRLETLDDPKRKRIFVGPESSEARWGAMKILESVGVDVEDFEPVDVTRYGSASEMLQTGDAVGLEAAFFLSPKAEAEIAVADAAKSECCELLHLWKEADSEPIVPGLSRRKIPENPWWERWWHGAFAATETPDPLRTLESNVLLGLVFGPRLAEHPRRNELAAVMVLYRDLFHVVVRNSSNITNLRDLKGSWVFVGRNQSATRWGAMKILESVEIDEGDFKRVDLASYESASKRLCRKIQDKKLDAAFFLTAGPAIAVKNAMGSGQCTLLSFSESERDEILRLLPSLSKHEIPAHVYEHQPDQKRTVGGSALLVANKDKDHEIVRGVLGAIFDHISELQVARIRVQDIRLYKAFKDLPEKELHDGAKEFRDKENEKLWIATGVINGKYYDLGKRLERVLELRGVESRVIHTDGSIENLKLLEQHERTIAITQYDTALASVFGDPYGAPKIMKEIKIPRVDRLRRMAVLHKEMLHVVLRVKKNPNLLDDEGERDPHPTLELLKLKDNNRVCLGAPESGTQVLARLLLDSHGVNPSKKTLLSVPDMVSRINTGELDAGFFMSAIPSEVLKTLVQDNDNRLLSVDPGSVARLLGPALSLARIDAKDYGTLHSDEYVDTVSTRAVLVAKENLSKDLVEKITREVFETQDYLRIPFAADGKTEMDRELKGLKLHPGARLYYQAKGLIPTPRNVFKEWLEFVINQIWKILAIVVILLGGSTGALEFKRQTVKRALLRRVQNAFELPSTRCLEVLGEIRKDAFRRVPLPWWALGELDYGRWATVRDVIDEHKKESART